MSICSSELKACEGEPVTEKERLGLEYTIDQLSNEIIEHDGKITEANAQIADHVELLKAKDQLATSKGLEISQHIELATAQNQLINNSRIEIKELKVEIKGFKAREAKQKKKISELTREKNSLSSKQSGIAKDQAEIAELHAKLNRKVDELNTLERKLLDANYSLKVHKDTNKSLNIRLKNLKTPVKALKKVVITAPKLQCVRLNFLPIKDKDWVKTCDTNGRKYKTDDYPSVSDKPKKFAVCHPDEYHNYYSIRNDTGQDILEKTLKITSTYSYRDTRKRGSKLIGRLKNKEILKLNIAPQLPTKLDSIAKTDLRIGNRYTTIYDRKTDCISVDVPGEESVVWFGHFNTSEYGWQRSIEMKYMK